MNSIPPNDLSRAMEALNAIFVMLRHIAVQDKCSEKMYRILDSIEVVPLLLLQGEPGLKKCDDILSDLARQYPFECNLALQRFKVNETKD